MIDPKLVIVNDARTLLIVNGSQYTVGKPVRFCLSATQERAALITRIWSQGSLNLIVYSEEVEDWLPESQVSMFDPTINEYPCWRPIP